MKPGVMAGIVVAILLAVGAFVFLGSEDSTDTDTSNNTPTVVEDADTSDRDAVDTNDADEADAAEQTTIGATEVAAHSSADDCWTIIDGVVYDLTSYIPRHPGGDEVLRACGADGTSLFQQRETSDGESVGSGTPHSSNATNQLANFKIGDLAQ